MKILKQDVNDFIDTFPETTVKLVNRFWKDKSTRNLCAEFIHEIVNGKYNTSPIKGEIETHYKVDELFDVLFLDLQRRNAIISIFNGFLEGLIIQMYCYVFKLNTGIVKKMKKDNPEGYDELIKAGILTGLKAIAD